MRAINLLPTHAGAEKTERTGLAKHLPFVAAGAVPVFCLALVVIGYRSGHSVVTVKQAKVAELQAELVKVTPAPVAVPAPSPDAAALVADRAARLAALKDVLSKEVQWDSALGDLARVLPSTVWLTSLNATSPTPADATATATPPPAPTTGAPTGAVLTLGGLTYTQADLAALIARLQLLPTLTNVKLTTETQTVVNKKSLIQFQVNATIQPPGGAPVVPAATTTTPATTATTSDTTTTTPAEPTQ